jgi:glucose-6-phosphate 1-dehydrogenase
MGVLILKRWQMESNFVQGIAFVIFGVTGDLTRRKLLPALYELHLANQLPEPICVIGFARRNWSDEDLQQKLMSGIKEFARHQPVDEKAADELLYCARYVQSTFDDSNGYRELARVLKDKEIKNVVYYLATPPEDYSLIVKKIGECGLNQGFGGWTRIVIEKPYGSDLTTAQTLEADIHSVFSENQVYRIDHYLGKETVQNILVFRFANGIFDPLWNRNYVDHVQITVSETVGVGTRAGYYEKAGVIRDILQNHLLQLLTLTAMEAPSAFNADTVRDEKVKVLHALRPLKGMDAIQHTYRAQYVSGLFDNQRVPGYKDESGVAANSTTETYLAAKLLVDNWRWAGVPFYLRSGKRLPARVTEIAIQFKQIPLSLFNWKNMAGDAPNVLVLNIQPNEGITLTFGAKAPGTFNQISPVKMDFNYEESFGVDPPEAYERLIQDFLIGDPTLFTRSDEVLAQWTFTTRLLEAWQEFPVRYLPVYESGTWGPPGADEFIKRDGREWRTPQSDEKGSLD